MPRKWIRILATSILQSVLMASTTFADIRHSSGDAPFDLLVAVEPTTVPNQARVVVRAELTSPPGKLPSPPTVVFTLTGHNESRVIPMQFESRVKNYVGFINDLPIDVDANLQVTATDASARTVTRFASVSMTRVGPDMTTTIFSSDGAVSLSVPDGALPPGTRVALGPSAVPPPQLQPGFAIVIGPVNAVASGTEPLKTPATLRFNLPHLGDLPGTSGFDPRTFQILRYDPATAKWMSEGSGTLIPSPVEKVTHHPTGLGVFLLIGHLAPPGVGGGPDVSAAVPTIAQLWPPDHRLVSVGITGVTSSTGGPITILITSIRSDEPPQDNPGDQCPDAINAGATAHLRADRSSSGDGRVYTLYFTALDDAGRSNSGIVRVCVPHDQPAQGTCVEGLVHFDPTACSP